MFSISFLCPADCSCSPGLSKLEAITSALQTEITRVLGQILGGRLERGWLLATKVGFKSCLHHE